MLGHCALSFSVGWSRRTLPAPAVRLLSGLLWPRLADDSLWQAVALLATSHSGVWPSTSFALLTELRLGGDHASHQHTPAQTLLCSTLLLSWHHSQQFNTTAHEVMCTVNLPAELWERILLSSCLIGSRRKLYDEHLRRLIRVCQALSCRAVTPLQTVKAGSLSD